MNDPLEAAAWAALDAKLDPASPAPLAVAVSGGGDSVALMHIAARWSRRAGRELHVLTVDHGLRPESAGWAERVSSQAAELRLSCRTLRWEGPKPAAGLPARARAARHALLASAAREIGARVLLLGHTLDDHRETELIRAEGTPIGALRLWAPSPAWPEGRGVFLLRPLLPLGREALRGWLRKRNATWLEDPANADSAFARARVRAAIARAAGDDVEAHWSEFDRAPSPSAAEARTETDGRVLLTRAGRTVLRYGLACASGSAGRVGRESLDGVLRRVSGSKPVVLTLGGARVTAQAAEVQLSRDMGRSPPGPVPIALGEALVWDGRFEIRADEPGVLLPAAGLRARLPRADRDRLRASPPWVRPTLPVLQTRAGVCLAPAVSLVGQRLRAALGAITREAEIA